MGTYIKVTYVALDNDGNKPIMTANTFDELKEGLDEYYGAGQYSNIYDTGAICIGFEPYVTKYPDDYEGCYEYKYTITQADGTVTEYNDKIKVYCVDYHPQTILNRK